MIDIIATDQAPTPRGHYAQATRANGLLFVAGQLPITAVDRRTPNGVAEQTRLVLRNLEAILHAAGSAVDKVLSLQVFITDPGHWSEVDAEFAAFFGDHRPARTIVPVLPLANGALIEVNAVALG